MSKIGTLITATDYNTIQSTLSDIFGLGENGYGIPVLQSSPLTTGRKVTAKQWNYLLADINTVHEHIAGAFSSTQAVVTSTSIQSTIVDELLPTSEWLNDSSRRWTCHPDKFLISTGTSTTFYGDGFSVRTLPWGVDLNSITHKVVTTFPDRLAALYYFNLGCFLTFTPYYVVGTGLNDLDLEWSRFIDYLRTPEQEYRYSRNEFISYSSTVTSWSSGTLTISLTAAKAVDETEIEFTTVYTNNASATLIVSPSVATWTITV